MTHNYPVLYIKFCWYDYVLLIKLEFSIIWNNKQIDYQPNNKTTLSLKIKNNTT